MHNPASGSWSLYRTFLSVVREGSLSAAARELGLTQPTVGRQVEQLEQQLGVSLFVRGQRGLTPTEAALELVGHAEAMASAAAALERAASGSREAVTGTVRLAASDIVGCEVLPAMLADFRELHPGVGLELAASNRLSNLMVREADIAVRMTRPEQGALIARPMGTVRIGLFAHRRYAERHGLPGSIEALRRHATVGFEQPSRLPPSVTSTGIDLRHEHFDFRTDNDVAQLAAIRAGMGIGGVQLGIAATEPDLVPVLPEQIGFSLEMWLVMHEDTRSVRRVRLLFDFLAETLTAYCKRDNG